MAFPMSFGFSSKQVFRACTAAALLLMLLNGIGHSWVNDDAFISFRYAKNLVEGRGLVYNTGERVEGYTNFLWTVIIAAGMGLGIDPVTLAIGLGIIFSLATILALAYLAREL